VRREFPRAARLTREREFEDVYRRGFRIVVPPLHARVLFKDDAGSGAGGDAGRRSRLGLSVGKRLGGAAVRNRWKRAIREAFRLHRDRLPAPCDLVVGVTWESTIEDVAKVEQAFLGLADALGERLKSGTQY